MSKKAVSPLIAVVLLMVVVVGVGALIAGTVRNLVQENEDKMDSQIDQTACSRDVVVDLVRIDRDPQICLGTNFVDAVIENKGSVDIDDFQLMIFGTTGIVRNDSWNNGTFSMGQSKQLNMTFSGISRSDIQQVKLVPKLNKVREAGYFYCLEAALTYEGVDDC